MQLERRAVETGVRPALVLVDFSLGFTRADSPLGGEFDAVVEAAARLLAAFRERRLPVCFSTVVYRRPDEARVFRARLPALELLQGGSRWVEIDPRLAPGAAEPVFEKHFASVFHGTTLAEWLRSRRADSVVVAGLTTSGCVRATAVDALQHDYPVVVAREAVGDRDAAAQAANLRDLHAKYAEVLGVDEILAGLVRAEEVRPGER
jgi:nicotinamidase-related amidase